MQSILVDAGPLIAIFDRRDKYHERAVNFIKAANTPLVTSLAVVTEVVLTLDFSLEAQTSFLKWAHMALDTDRNIVDDLPRIVEIMEKYRNLPADFADASIVALAERVGLRDVATIDNDFSIYRTKSKQRFTNVFPDR